jgi:hypothetical protein
MKQEKQTYLFFVRDSITKHQLNLVNMYNCGHGILDVKLCHFKKCQCKPRFIVIMIDV